MVSLPIISLSSSQSLLEWVWFALINLLQLYGRLLPFQSVLFA